MPNMVVVNDIPAPRKGKRTQRSFGQRGARPQWPGRFQRAREVAPKAVRLTYPTAMSAQASATKARTWTSTEPDKFQIVARSNDDGTGSVYIQYLGE